MKTGAVILAAGKASRFGSPKQLLEMDGETLLDRACRTALEAGCDPIVRILGAHADLILDRRCPDGVETLLHADWEMGMGSSLAAGVSHLLALCPELEAVFVLLPDQPSVTVELLETLKPGLQSASIVWCGYQNVTGPPALFARKHFKELLALEGDRGAKVVAARHQAVVMPFPEAAWDIDSLETWEKFLTRL
jgi:molybdenum cofactor cytidylyltransferase